MAIITLLTDFGLQDEYVGVLKGVILGIHPEVRIVDITHGIPPQDVKTAAYTLKSAFHFFPQHTIHVTIVDPGVGSQRRIIAVTCAMHIFLAPDNGLLIPLLTAFQPEGIYCVENENLFKHPVSRTFHGRDIFAPVAAHLSLGMSVKNLGRSVSAEELQSLTVCCPAKDCPGTLEGEVVNVDRFGNLITNINDMDLTEMGTTKIVVILGCHMIERVVDAYTEGRRGEACAIIGSRNCLEIFINNGSAAHTLNCRQGDRVQVNKKGKEEGIILRKGD